jgi:hypothetical protein
MYDHGDGVKYCAELALAPDGSNAIVGAVVKLKGAEQNEVVFKFVPGEKVANEMGQLVLVPGQRMTSVNGEFIPGASIRNYMHTQPSYLGNS